MLFLLLLPFGAHAQELTPNYSCLMLGDSIASGVNTALVSKGIRCSSITKKPKKTLWISEQAPSEYFDTVIVSAGSNDRENSSLPSPLKKLRSKPHARLVLFLIPYNRDLASSFVSVAGSSQDVVLDLRKIPSRDDVHPDYNKTVKAIFSL